MNKVSFCSLFLIISITYLVTSCGTSSTSPATTSSTTSSSSTSTSTSTTNTLTPTTSISTTTLTSDFQSCTGKPASPSFVEGERLLIATSSDGLNFTRTNQVLFNRATVPDAVVLPSGRIMVYFVAAGYVIGGVEIPTNETVVAVSDDNGSSWVFKKLVFNGVPSGATPPVDPNVVLKPDGNLRLFATIDPDTGGTQKACTYSFLSTDGGFTFNLEGKRFSVSGIDVLDPENFRFSDSNWKIWAGTRHAISTDGNNFTDQGIFSPNGDIPAEITDFSTGGTSLYRMYVHSGGTQPGSNNYIKSLTSTDTVNWTSEAGSRLTLDPSTGKESDHLMFPTVVRLSNGSYLMIYETAIP